MARERVWSPNGLLVAAGLFCLLSTAACLYFSLQQPWLGLALSTNEATGMIVASAPLPDAPEGGTIASIGGMALEATDLVEDPDTLGSDAARDRFMQRQGELHRLLSSESVAVTLAGGTVATLHPEPLRPVLTLPPSFWVQVLSGAIGFMVGAWVWCFKPYETAPRFFFLSGIGLMVSAHAAAIYSSRELALPTELFIPLSKLNATGTGLFGLAITGLFLNSPAKLLTRLWRQAILGLLALAHLVALLDLVPDSRTAVYGLIFVDMVLILAAIGAQVRATRGDPVGRTALRWLALSVLVGTLGFMAVVGAPVLLGGEAIVSQGYAFGLFAVIYFGIALGLSRHRLFDLGEWAFRLLFFLGAAALIVVLDGLLVLLLQIGPRSALGLGLIAVALIYLPLRDRLWRLTAGRRILNEDELLAGVTGIAFAPNLNDGQSRLAELLRRMFDPLEMTVIEAGPEAPALTEDGAVLLWPATRDTPAMQLRYPWSGRGLFSAAHLAMARRALALLERFQSGREAYAEGARAERRRIARDLHDDVGARLLTGMHEAPPQARPLLREALADIRTIVGGLTGEQRTLDRVLGDLRHETVRRLEAAGIALDWPVDDAGDARLLDYDIYKNLSSVFRELVSNLIRHAGAGTAYVRVRSEADLLVIEIADDGIGLGETAPRETGGNGLRNAAERLTALGGEIAFPSAEKGTSIRITLPLPAPYVTPEQGVQSSPAAP